MKKRLKISNQKNMQILQCYKSVKRGNDGVRPSPAPYAADVEVTVDRSGSMQSMYKETCEGVKDFVADQKRLQSTTGTPTVLRLTTFDNVVETMKGFDGVSITSVPDVDNNCLHPRNTTRLIDTSVECLMAQARRVKKLRKNMSTEVKKLDPQIVTVFALLTDGHDNESRLYSSRDLNTLLHKYKNDGGVAMFLAAGQDAVNTGQMYGFGAKDSLTYTASGKHAGEAMRAMTDQIGRVCSGGLNTGFSALQRTSSHAGPTMKKKKPAGMFGGGGLQRAPAGMFGGGRQQRTPAGMFGGGGLQRAATGR